MFYEKRIHIISVVLLFVFYLFYSSSLGLAQETITVFSEIEEKLGSISEKEQKVLQELFFILQDIEEMERQQVEIEGDIKKIKDEIENVSNRIEKEENIYGQKRDTLKEVLQVYQRRGPASYLEIILSSDSFSTLIRRINIIRDLSRNTGALLEELDERKQILQEEKSKLDDALFSLEEKQGELKKALLNKEKLRNDMEDYLASLDVERSYYENQLNQIDKAWTEAKKTLTDSIANFSDVLKQGNLPYEKIKVTITLGRVKGSIDEETFNQVAKQYIGDKAIEFHFYENKIQAIIPDSQFSVSGSFIIVDGHTLQFVAEEGSFYGMTLTEESLEEIFRNGQVQLNLEPVLYGNELESVKIKEGYFEISSKVSFF
ncbi:MAG: hypothetical protein GX272_05620 [Epulopiscium sp.]|nr:hypothetical protein [Candidatus Epulonipiscium sp.]